MYTYLFKNSSRNLNYNAFHIKKNLNKGENLMNTVKHKYSKKTNKIMTKVGFGYNQISSLVTLSVICPCSDGRQGH